MKFPRKLLPVFIFLLSTISILRLIKHMLVIPSPSPSLAAQPPAFHHSYPTPPCNTTSTSLNISGGVQRSLLHHTALTEKEFGFLSSLINSRVPCNLLVFGLEPQYTSLTVMNRGGYTIFLDDNPEKLSTVGINSATAKIYRVKYYTAAADAFTLLKYARENKVCQPQQGFLRNSSCQLALTNLPEEVYGTMWDFILVDGPSGHKPDAPGRMAAIYTAGMLARATKNTTQVIVHDVDRMIEKWFSWEYLCEENLASAKGKLWNFTISKNRNSTSFCTNNNR
uniref:Polysaccharide biosynthesis domain-containing protein n=1 Tax=Kalanchoe fedtschenkoi TaxID=63787 RepID=A0A7N0VDR8_KALFE